MERLIRKYRVNKDDKNSYRISIGLLKLINKFSKSKNSFTIIKQISDIFNIPQETVNLKFKKLLHGLMDYKSGKFKQVSSLSPVIFFKEIFKCVFLIITTFISFKKNKYKKYDFIIHGIEDKRSFERYEQLIKLFKSPLIISKKKLKFKTKKISTFYNKDIFYSTSRKQVNGKKLKIIVLYLKIIFITLRYNFNYIYFLNLILYSVLKNHKLFETRRGKYFMEDRFYNICPIRNYYFKKFGGILTSTPQKNILETSISSYISIDIFFSLADEKFSPRRIKDLGGNFKRIVPVGSFFLEQDWYKKVKDQKKISKIDILFTGLKPNDWLYINNINQQNNNLYRIWIKKIAKLYPHLSINIKNHGDLKENKFEEEFFKNTNVQILKNKSINASYGYINKSKLIFSLGSTTILESICMGKNGYFINPASNSKNFFYGMRNLDRISIKSLNQLKKIIHVHFALNNKVKVKKNQYCLKSDNVSKRVFNFFKNLND